MRNKNIGIRISEKEKTIIEELAKKSNMTLSEYMISCSLLGNKVLLKKETIISLEKEL